MEDYKHNKDIKRFCELTKRINKIHKEIEKESEDFYSGGYSFEEANGFLIEQLPELETEFLEILNRLK